MKTLKLGTRGSKLALWQADHVAAALRRHVPAIELKIEIIRTTGDKILDVALSKIGDKGLFTKEIEQALLQGDIDLAVHSMKDVPTALEPGLEIAAVMPREAVADVLIAPGAGSLRELPPGAQIGTSSLRRISQLKAFRPDLQVAELRGNVETRLRRMTELDLDGVLLAEAGVKRLGLAERISQSIDTAVMLPAVGQGAIGIEIRQDDGALRALLTALNHEPSAVCVRAERAFLAALGGGCQVPIAALAQMQGEAVVLDGLIASLDGSQVWRDQITMPRPAAERGGTELARRLLDRGGAAVLAELRQL